MLSRLEIVLDLLHSSALATLATQSATLPGYPFASSVPFAVDERHRPLLLISRLAEHTRNLAADSRACLLAARPLADGEITRVSLVGEVKPIEAEPRLVARYLRYHPEAERFLQLGDFRFHRLEPLRILVVGGFGQAGWLDGQRLADAAQLSLDREAELLASAQGILPRGTRLLGLDAYGADFAAGDTRSRIVFADAPLSADAILAALAGVGRQQP